MGRLFFTTLVCLLCLLPTGCGVAPASAFSWGGASANAASIVRDIPVYLTVEKPLETRHIYNRSYPVFTATIPVGQYNVQPAMSKFGTYYYKPNRPVKLTIDEGSNHRREVETTGYLVFQESDFKKGGFDPSELKFLVSHTGESRSLLSGLVDSMRRFAALKPTGADEEEAPPKKTETRFLDFRVGFDRHIYHAENGKNDKTVPNGNKIAITFPLTNGR